MKISKHIHLLKIPFKIPITPELQIDRFVNVYIVEGKYITLIDAGVAGSEKVIFEYLKSIGRKPEEIKWVLLTHTHPDHIGAAKTIKEITGCKIAVHEAEKDWLEDVEKQCKERPVPGFYTLVAGSVKADKLLSDSDILDIGDDILIKAIHCPGHSAGSTAFLYSQENAMFTGDVIPINGDIPIYDSYEASIKSLEKIENLPFADRLLSAWDEPKEGDDVEVAISNGFDVLYQVHTSYLKAKAQGLKIESTEFVQAILADMGLPNKFVNPLFVRALVSHK